MDRFGDMYQAFSLVARQVWTVELSCAHILADIQISYRSNTWSTYASHRNDLSLILE